VFTLIQTYKEMIEHYSPLLTSIKTMFGYKTHSLIGAATVSAGVIETFNTIINGTYMGVSGLLLIVISGLIIVDWGLGTAADDVIRYNMNGWNIPSLVKNGAVFTIPGSSFGGGLFFKEDGTKMYILTLGAIREYNLI